MAVTLQGLRDLQTTSTKRTARATLNCGRGGDQLEIIIDAAKFDVAVPDTVQKDHFYINDNIVVLGFNDSNATTLEHIPMLHEALRTAGVTHIDDPEQDATGVPRDIYIESLVENFKGNILDARGDSGCELHWDRSYELLKPYYD